MHLPGARSTDLILRVSRRPEDDAGTVRVALCGPGVDAENVVLELPEALHRDAARCRTRNPSARPPPWASSSGKR